MPTCGHPEPVEESIERFEQLRQQELKDAASSNRHRLKGVCVLGLISGIFVVCDVAGYLAVYLLAT